MVNAGEGTLKFASRAYQLGGVCEVASGTVDFSEAGRLDEVKLSGAGVVKGLNAARARISVAVGEDWSVEAVPEFEGKVPDRVTVDFGRSGSSFSNELPKGIVLGKVPAGTDVSCWRIANTGFSRVSGRFSVNGDGEVVVDLERVGMDIIVR